MSSTVVAPDYILTNCILGYLFLHMLSNIYLFIYFGGSHFNRDEAVLHCGFCWISSWHAHPLWVLAQVLAAPLIIKLPANKPGKAKEGGPSPQCLQPEERAGRGSLFRIGSFLAVVAIWGMNHCLEDLFFFFSLSLPALSF